MRFLIRTIAVMFPVLAALSLGRAAQAGTLAKEHVSNAKALAFIAACFLVAWLVLYMTRKKGGGNQQRRPAAPTFRRR